MKINEKKSYKKQNVEIARDAEGVIKKKWGLSMVSEGHRIWLLVK